MEETYKGKPIIGSSSADVPLVVILSGLPARGKSYYAQKILTFLTWRGLSVKIFNAGDYRRKYEGIGQSADYFATNNHAAAAERETLARMAFQDLLKWVDSGGEVALFDATNSTVRRRRVLVELCREYGLPSPLFIESIINDEVLLERNYKLKLGNADYKGQNPSKALTDFKQRVAEYAKRYETIGTVDWEEDMSYIKLFTRRNGKKIILNNCNGWLNSQILTILQNFHTTPRRIFLTRPAEVCPKKEKENKIYLTTKGKEYTLKLVDFIKEQQSKVFDDKLNDFVETVTDSRSLTLLSSGLGRSFKTLEPTLNQFVNTIPRRRAYSGVEVTLKSISSNASTTTVSSTEIEEFNIKQTVCTPALNPINTGFYPLGYSHSKMMTEHKDNENKDKLSIRFPGGESYSDVIQRIHPVVLELERQRNDLLVVSHTVPIRLILAYFNQKPASSTVYNTIKANTVLEIRPEAFGCKVIEHSLC